jgi:calcineurin-like phosphoesterase family protein
MHNIKQNIKQRTQRTQRTQRAFLISDTHFSHSNIIKYEQRPFKDTEEMDEYIIEQWNDTVTDNDIIFHLGDVAICGAKKAEKILKRLNGRKILIEGNHDSFSKTKWRKLGFEPYKRYFYKDYLLTHIPVDEQPLRIAVAEGFLKGNIHGHTHSKNQHLNHKLYKCCCVELIGYRPILFEEFISM